MQIENLLFKPDTPPEYIGTNCRTIKLFGRVSCFPNNFRFFVFKEILNFDCSRFAKNGNPASQGGISSAPAALHPTLGFSCYKS
jgi:hypothetical protein